MISERANDGIERSQEQSASPSFFDGWPNGGLSGRRYF